MALEQMYKPRRAAEMLGIPQYQIYRLADSGRLPVYKLASHAVRFKASDLRSLAKRIGDHPGRFATIPLKARWYSVEEVANILDASKYFVYEIIKRNEISPTLGPPVKSHRGTNREIYYIPGDCLRMYLEERRVG